MRRLKRLVFAAARHTGANALVADTPWRRARLLILCYHGVSLHDEHEALPELYIPPALLRRRLQHLKARSCTVLPLGVAIDRLYAGTLGPRSVAITFDDGTQDFTRRALPLLREFGMPATVYPTTYYCGRGQPIFDTALLYLLWRGRDSRADLRSLIPDLGPLAGPIAGLLSGPLPLVTGADRERASAAVHQHALARRLNADAKDALLRRIAEHVGVDYDAFLATGMFQVMSPDQIRALRDDPIDVELHTHRHRLPKQRAEFMRELADNRACLRALDVPAPTHFCYPNGDYRASAVRWLRAAGVESATTCVPGIATRAADPLTLPRFVDTCSVSDAAFDAWVSGVADLLPRRRANRIDTSVHAPSPDVEEVSHRAVSVARPAKGLAVVPQE